MFFGPAGATSFCPDPCLQTSLSVEKGISPGYNDCLVEACEVSAGLGFIVALVWLLLKIVRTYKRKCALSPLLVNYYCSKSSCVCGFSSSAIDTLSHGKTCFIRMLPSLKWALKCCLTPRRYHKSIKESPKNVNDWNNKTVILLPRWGRHWSKRGW